MRDLAAVYFAENERPLHEPFFAQCLTVFGKIFTASFTYKDEQSYRLFVLTSYLALIAFANRIHSGCLEKPPVACVFKLTHKLYDFVGTWHPARSGGGTFEFNPGQREAYDALGEPFKRNKAELQSVLNYSKSRPGHYLSPPSSDKHRREYDRMLTEAFDAATPVELALAGTPLYPYAHDFLPQQTIELPFELPDDIRFRGMFCCAPQGRGKTNLLRQLVEDDRKKKGCIILIDPKGDLIDCYRDKAFVIQPSLSNPPAINPLDLGSSIYAIDLLTNVFTSILDNKLSGPQTTVFNAVLHLATLIPDATVFTIIDILEKGPDQYEQVHELP